MGDEQAAREKKPPSSVRALDGGDVVQEKKCDPILRDHR
jgi:hypothetical protein